MLAASPSLQPAKLVAARCESARARPFRDLFLANRYVIAVNWDGGWSWKAEMRNHLRVDRRENFSNPLRLRAEW